LQYYGRQPWDRTERSIPPNSSPRSPWRRFGGDETVNNIAKKYEIHPNQISIWKTELIEGANNIVDRKRGKKPASEEPDREELLKTIGQLNVESDFLKNKSGLLR